jgi:hypothetical protein
MDNEARLEATAGQASNLMGENTDEVVYAITWMVPEIIVLPTRIIITLVLLYRLLGSCVILGK